MDNITHWINKNTGNWKNSSLAYSSEFSFLDKNWAEFALSNRDSSILEKSNAEYIVKKLEEYIASGLVVQVRVRSSGPGYGDCILVRLRYEDGTEAEVAAVLYDIFEDEKNYAVLDDDDYWRRMQKALEENVAASIVSFIRNEVDDDILLDHVEFLTRKVIHVLETHYPEQLEEGDHGAYPSDEIIWKILPGINAVRYTSKYENYTYETNPDYNLE